jgi:serine/threonine protein kinase
MQPSLKGAKFASMTKYGDWDPVGDKLGEGGQSIVYRARTPARVAQRQKSALALKHLSGLSLNDFASAEGFAEAIADLSRLDQPSELGALKVFKIRTGGAPAEERFKREVAVLREGKANLPRLLDADEEHQWMVTEYFPDRTLLESPTRYKGDALAALTAFRPLVETVWEALHQHGIVHRDIKPANVFLGSDGRLIPGDFGIVYLPDSPQRLTILGERVGPWDYMPPWADSLDGEMEDVKPNFDVYMLGKLLWCMVAGRLRLRREQFKESEFDLVNAFPDRTEEMRVINSILEKCLVERRERCLPTTKELLGVVDEKLREMKHGVPARDSAGKLILPCKVCGKGRYSAVMPELYARHTLWNQSGQSGGDVRLCVFVCSICTHTIFFAPGNPDEAATRGWK